MNLADSWCLTTAALYLLVYLCLFPAVCPVCVHTGVRDRHTHTESQRERASGKHYSDSCSRGSDYTGNEEREGKERGGGRGGIKQDLQSLISDTDTAKSRTKCVFSFGRSERRAGRWRRSYFQAFSCLPQQKPNDSLLNFIEKGVTSRGQCVSECVCQALVIQGCVFSYCSHSAL